GNPVPYEELIAQLTISKPEPLTPTKLLQWIQAMSQCISLLDKSCSALIEAMLQINWIVQDDVFVQYYMSFLGNVVSAHAFYVVPVQSMLVKKFTTRHRPSTLESESAVSRERQFDRVHQTLKYILDLIPTGPTSLFPLLAAEFPHKRESIAAHIIYVKNIIRVLDYIPVLRTQILSVVIDRIIQIDVEIQVELEELEDSDTEVVYDWDVPEDLEEEDESDAESESDDESGSDSDSGAMEVTVLNIKDMTRKLDGMLYLVFSYMKEYIDSCQHLSNENGQPAMPVQELFLVLLSIFMKTILQTFKSRHTQFLLFYCISLSPQFSDYFLGALLQQIMDKSQPQVVRVAAAAYMSSFVARAKYLDVRQVGMVIQMLGGFALETIEQVDTGSNVMPDAERYAVFYAVVQAMLYIFCFRWKVLTIDDDKTQSNKDDFESAGMLLGSMDGTSESNSRPSTTRQWHSELSSLQRIVTSRLNPLKICSDNVVKQFARISNSLNFMYIYPILEQNKKIYIHGKYNPSSGAGPDGNGVSNGQPNGGALPHELETFFPFDPYRLPKSAHFMRGIYQEWEDDEEDEDEDEEEEDYDDEYEEEEEEGEGDIDEDELEGLGFIGRNGAQGGSKEDEDGELTVNESIMAMSISPSPAHFLVQATMVDTQTISDDQRWSGVYKLLDRESLIHPEFVPQDEIKEFIKSCKILVIGAGGLGCEILKNLALSGFSDIHVIDMDTIDVSNLNRQFLFRRADVGKPKAVTAAAFINKRVQGVNVTPHYCKIQDKDEEFYQEFALIICGLDSIEARRWINATLVGMRDEDNPDSIKPLIDGGTEGFKGQARVILPGITSCYECSMDMLSKPTGFPLCTIANTPRLPEHCIEWASVLEWPNKHGDRKMDTDDPKDIQWLYETALARAKQYNIQGVTYSLTQGVVKNIIPAIAATNAIIAASCCNEALKIATTCAKNLDNYMMYSGNDSVYTYTFEHQRKEDCPVCSNTASKLDFSGEKTLEEFLDYLKEKPDVQLKKPSFALGGKPLYMQGPKQLEEALRPNLAKPLKEIISSGDEVTITDSTLPFSMQVVITLI
ncbi:hypothetical protein BGZ46_009641, partial [Entomortierella lignicola]